MELQKLTSVEVEVIDGSVIQVVAIEKEEGVLAKEIHEKVCQDLELSINSHRWFALYKGRKKVKKKYKDSDFIPSSCQQDLCIRKFRFNQQDEEEVMKSDPVACYLLYKEAESMINSGVLHPTKEQEEKLEEYSTDGLVNEKLYLSVCHAIKGYFSVRADNCLIADKETKAPITSAQTTVSAEDFTFSFGENTASVHIPWCCIIRWSINSSHSQLRLDYQDQSLTEKAVFIQTDQADFLLMGTTEFVKEAQASDPDHPPFFSWMITYSPDGQLTYENALFNIGKSTKYAISFTF